MQLGTIGTFDEDEAFRWELFRDGRLDSLYVRERADVRLSIGCYLRQGFAELFAHKPCGFRIERKCLGGYFLVCFLANGTQLFHVAENDHLMRVMDVAEIVQGGLHRGQVSVVGIDDELVVSCLAILGTS